MSQLHFDEMNHQWSTFVLTIGLHGVVPHSTLPPQLQPSIANILLIEVCTLYSGIFRVLTRLIHVNFSAEVRRDLREL